MQNNTLGKHNSKRFFIPTDLANLDYENLHKSMGLMDLTLMLFLGNSSSNHGYLSQ